MISNFRVTVFRHSIYVLISLSIHLKQENQKIIYINIKIEYIFVRGIYVVAQVEKHNRLNNKFYFYISIYTQDSGNNIHFQNADKSIKFSQL
jgi:hypothetical protein